MMVQLTLNAEKATALSDQKSFFTDAEIKKLK